MLASYPRRVLLMVTGRTPQVVTETLYALCVKQSPAFVPTEIHLITTAEGAKDAERALLDDPPGWLCALRQDYQLPEIAFNTQQHIHVLHGTNGQPMQDARSLEDHDSTADFITHWVRTLTADPEAALHVSLAGGRKTMSYYLGYVLSLFARRQDHLSHVLVSAPYESNPHFFYPTPYSNLIDSRTFGFDQVQKIDTCDAEVTLADIPFVRLREHLPKVFKDLEQGEMRFSQVVKTVQKALDLKQEKTSVCIDYTNTCLHTHIGSSIQLPPVELAFYAWVADNWQQQKYTRRPAGETADKAAAKVYLIHNKRAGGRPQTEQALQKKGMGHDFFDRTLSRTNSTIRKALGVLADAYLIKQKDITRGQGVCIGVQPEEIEFIND